MLRTVTLVAAIVFAAPAVASTCRRADPFDKQGPSVWIVGNVTKVVTREETPGTYMGATSVTRGRHRSGSNTATIEVKRVLKGNVSKEIEITSDLQDGINLGFSFREGPIVIAAYRGKDGTLYANGCSLMGSGETVASFNWDAPETTTDHNGTRRNPLIALSNLANRIAELGNPMNPQGMDPERLSMIDELLTSARDRERRAGMWEAVTALSPTAANRARLAAAYLNAGRYEEAKRAAEASAGEGSADAIPFLNTAKLHLGEDASPSMAYLKDEWFKTLELTGAILRGKDLSGLRIDKATASAADFSGSKLVGIQIYEGRLADAVLSQADLTGARIDATLNGAKFHGSVLDDTYLRSNSGFQDLTEARGRKPSFSGFFNDAVFNGVTFKEAQFHEVTLDRSTFSNAMIENSSFRRVSLKGADLSEAVFVNVTWGDVIYDCSTKFPAGLNPVLSGFQSSESCPGYTEADLAGVKVEKCDESCFRWLSGSLGRKFRIDVDGKGSFTMGSSYPGRDECSSEAIEIARVLTWGKAPYLEHMIGNGFCPVLRKVGANPPESFFAMNGEGSQWEVISRDLEQVRYFDFPTIRNVVHPRVVAHLEKAGPSGFVTLALAIPSYGRNAHLLGDLAVKYLSMPPSIGRSRDGAGMSEEDALSKVTKALIADAAISAKVLDALNANPSLASAPRFRAYLAETLRSGLHRFTRPRTCESLGQVLKHLPEWGIDSTIDGNLVLVVSLCRESDFGLTMRGLRDNRQDVREKALLSWTYAVMNRTPAAQEGSRIVQSMLDEGSIPAAWTHVRKQGNPKSIVQDRLSILAKGPDALKERGPFLLPPDGGGRPAFWAVPDDLQPVENMPAPPKPVVLPGSPQIPTLLQEPPQAKETTDRGNMSYMMIPYWPYYAR